MSHSSHFGYNRNFSFKCKRVTPAGSKLRDRESWITIHFLKFAKCEDLKTQFLAIWIFTIQANRMVSKSSACYILAGLGLRGKTQIKLQVF